MSRIRRVTFRELQFGTRAYEDALTLRNEVLRKPLGLSLTKEELSHESDCFHLGGFDGERLVAILLLQPLDQQMIKMRQVAVHPEFQTRGIGAQLVAFAERFARRKGCKKLVAHARKTALEFYTKIGYTACGEEFMETAIPHRLVMKLL